MSQAEIVSHGREYRYSFYLPPEVFQNPDFERGLKMFVTPDGKGVRFIITHQGDPASVDGIKHVAGVKDAVADAIKGTPLEGSNVWLAGTASMYSDMQNGVVLDLLVAGIASLILIFAIMLLITRSVVAALVIVGTVAASLGTACGLSVLIWQDITGFVLQWIVLPLSVVILLAVGSDYNLLVVSRLKEEIRAGLNTGIIRGMGASGRVVTAAGMVFAFTMASMLISDLRVVGQLGATIGLGLLVDTFYCSIVHDPFDCRRTGALVLVAAEYLPHSHQGHLECEARPRHRADSPANDRVTEVFGVIR